MTLTIDEAIQRGLIYNLGAIAASVRRHSAEASILGTRSALLPSISGSISENVDRADLAAEGFDASSLPSIREYFPSAIGPFHYYSAEAKFSQSPLDLVAIRNLMAARETGRAAGFSQRDVREQVVLAVAAAYLQVLAQNRGGMAGTFNGPVDFANRVSCKNNFDPQLSTDFQARRVRGQSHQDGCGAASARDRIDAWVAENLFTRQSHFADPAAAGQGFCRLPVKRRGRSGNGSQQPRGLQCAGDTLCMCSRFVNRLETWRRIRSDWDLRP